MSERERVEVADPVRHLPVDRGDELTDERALCLSGGGYRAMLFHVGVLWRLNEAGWLGKLDRISSVSGGSVTAGVLGRAWADLDFDADGKAGAFDERVVRPLRDMAGHGIDVGAVLKGLALPGSIGEKVAEAYRRHLFDDATLQVLPNRPLFVLNATNVGSGALARFTKPYLADWRVGRIHDPEIELAVAVACSSAFPPVLSPYRLKLAGAAWTTDEGNDLDKPEYRDELVLTDGGVYDNLGLETAWKRCRTLIVADAGGQMAPEAGPASDWPRHMLRVLKVIDNQVRSLRKRQVIDSLARGDREGVYVGIRSDVADYKLDDPLPAPHEATLRLAEIPTRLDDIEPLLQERLINWGYIIGDTGLRKHLDDTLDRPERLPYPDAGVG